MTDVTRRTALAGAAAAAAVVAAPAHAQNSASPAPAPAAAPTRQAPGFYRQKLGTIEVLTISDGVAVRELPGNFVRDVPPEAVREALAAVFVDASRFTNQFTQTVIDTGSDIVMLDTGTGGLLGPATGHFATNFAAAGLKPEQVRTIVISHFHPDHINGLRTREGALAYPNAEIHVHETEWAFWMSDDNMARLEALRGVFNNVRRVFGDIRERVKTYRWGAEVVTGVTAIDAKGHTPGHTAFAVASGSASMLVMSDTANHPALFVRNPEWSPIFDMDAAVGRTTRRAMLDRAAADRMLVTGYHFPFPSAGFIAKEGNGFRFVPQQWTPLG